MNIKQIEKSVAGVKIFVEEDGKEIGRAWLYLIHNNLHIEPYGLLEDVYVDENYRKRGVGNKLLKKIIALAKEKKCYKLLATSRHSRKEVHGWYERLGFKEYGSAFRMDLK
ncbi:MAG: GNAT family N-acetyltransferase [Candidatus Magasanikbacteria bacterium]|jgi:GNAT superfamily N-acetyltransferase